MILALKQLDELEAEDQPAASILDSSTTQRQIPCSYRNRCNRPDCLICQSRKASNKAYVAAFNLNDKPNLYLVSLTFEQREDETLAEKLEHLRGSWFRLKR